MQLSQMFPHKIDDKFAPGSEKIRTVPFQKFSLLDSIVLIEPAEVFDVFVDISDDLTLEKGSFLSLMSRAGEL